MSVSFQSAAIPKCYDRLRKAERALGQCKKAVSFADFSSNWTDFLVHTGGVLNLIQAGAEQTPQGRQWHGGIKRFGRSDELISYLHQARNSVEHSVADSLAMKPQVVTIGYKQDFVGGGILKIDEEFFRNPNAALDGWVDSEGKPLVVTNTPSGPHPLEVHDERFKKAFYPPSEHLGKPLLDRSPLSIGAHYIDYLRSLIKEAEALP
jgi:hypothetical protein